ncbi:molecular chaperone [Providencia rettgeri]|nr:molecular chaperone [Providencia rettgeri]
MSIMVIRFFLLSFSFVFIFSCAKADGIALNQSRIIFSEKDNSQIAQVRNETNDAFLIQSAILKEVDGGAVNNFIVAPPLFKILPKSEYSVRIIPNKIDELPKDKESIFYFKIRALPSVNKNESDENKIGMVFVTAIVIKLYYRPELIKSPSQQDYKKLTLVKKDGGWSFYNPTPYYMTVVDFNVGGNMQSSSVLIPPYDYYKINRNNINGGISWRLLNDFGTPTEKFYLKISENTGS